MLTRITAWTCAGLLLAPLVLLGDNAENTVVSETQSIDCAGNARALWEAEPVVQHQDGDEIHQYWIFTDRADLWEAAVPDHEALGQYRRKFREVVPDVRPLSLIRTNRERFPWLERDYPAEGRINRAVEAGVGTHRPMSCLETQILAYQAARFPLYEQPTEIVALILVRSDPAGDLVKVYIAADDDSVPPKPQYAVESAEADVAAGWRLHSLFHNHTFSHSEDHGHLPVPAPSSNDVQFSVALSERLGSGLVLVTDGFNTFELNQDELRQLEHAVASSAAEPDE